MVEVIQWLLGGSEEVKREGVSEQRVNISTPSVNERNLCSLLTSSPLNFLFLDPKQTFLLPSLPSLPSSTILSPSFSLPSLVLFCLQLIYHQCLLSI